MLLRVILTLCVRVTPNSSSISRFMDASFFCHFHPSLSQLYDCRGWSARVVCFTDQQHWMLPCYGDHRSNNSKLLENWYTWLHTCDHACINQPYAGITGKCELFSFMLKITLLQHKVGLCLHGQYSCEFRTLRCMDRITTTWYTCNTITLCVRFFAVISLADYADLPTNVTVDCNTNITINDDSVLGMNKYSL